MTDSDQEVIGSVIAAAINAATAPLKARIAALEGQKAGAMLDAAIEKHSSIATLNAAVEKHQGAASSYKGPWTEGRAYIKNDVVMLAGRIWHANRLTRARPGSDSSFTLGPVKNPVRIIGR